MPDQLVILDIAGVLATAPDRGPQERIADALGLDAAARDALGAALLTTEFEDPGAIAAWLGRPEAEAAIEDVWIADQDAAEPLPGALEALERLAASATLAVLADVWPPYLVGVLDHFDDAFDALVAYRAYSFATGVAKPDPRAFTQLLDVAGVAAADAVMVSAATGDREAARALGLRTATSLGEVA